MQLLEGRLVASPSDLTGYLECEHLTQQELAAARGEISRPSREDPFLDVLSRRGLEHEATHLGSLKANGRKTVEFTFPESSLAALEKAREATVAAMRTGVETIYQGTFFDGRWRCHPDFLIRVNRPSSLGDYSYEVADTKLARKLKAAAVLQCCVYSEQLATIQGFEPEQMTLILGNGRSESLRVKDYGAYFRTVKRRFEETVIAEALKTYPDPVSHCGVCRWTDVCEDRRRQDDHLSIVAGMRRDQTRRLQMAGVPTMKALAVSNIASIDGISDETLRRLQQQANLQVRRQDTGQLSYELISSDGDHLGFRALPEPTGSDLFFDMEGDPLRGENGLQYLFGIIETPDGIAQHHAFWAHDSAAEKTAFEGVMDLFIDRLNRHPDLHIYHYAAYEPNALKWLSSTYSTREEEVDRLLRGGALVDLYRVVRQSVRVGTESYSLKALEALYRGKRTTDIVDAGASIVAYEEWLVSQDQEKLDQIAAYNQDDCLSTAELRDWLEDRRTEAIAKYGEMPRPGPERAEASQAIRDVEDRTAPVFNELLAGVPEQEESRSADEQAHYLLGHSLNWHRREGKSEWQKYFDRTHQTDEQLIDDRDSIGVLEFRNEERQEKQSKIFRYHFDPNQEYKIAVGDQPHDPRRKSSAGTVVGLDSVAGWIELARGVRINIPHPTSLIPASPIPTRDQREAILSLGNYVAGHGFEGAGDFRVARDVLCLRPPRFRGINEGASLVQAGERAKDIALLLAPRLEDSYLAIQGPPGSGKTTLGAEIILDLVKLGKRVGITANSHKVIGNLLDKLMEAAHDRGQAVRAIQKADENDRCKSDSVQCSPDPKIVEAKLDREEVDVVAGTSWLFARPTFPHKLDYLVVDEAGQMALANVLAISGATRNFIFLGDPNQLSQPTQGTHPPGVNRSVLDHLIQKKPTMPSDYGLFLETTYRLHPTVCRFISEAFYDGRLEPDESTMGQMLATSNGSGGLGLRYVPVAHAGNRTLSPEEAQRTAQTFRALIDLPWTDRKRQTRPLGIKDILVVAPYTAQVRRLIETLPNGVEVGTVDKFQGQEAPVVIYSMATSSVDDAPRGMDFLFSLNRLNVAASRAQGLVILVCSPELLKARCRTPLQMRLASALCRLVEMAQPNPAVALNE